MRARLLLIAAGLVAVGVVALLLVRLRASDQQSGTASSAADPRSGGGARPSLHAVDAGKPALDCTSPRGAVATVDGTPIDAEQLCRSLVKLGGARGAQVDRAQAKQLLDRMIDAALVRRALARANTRVEEAEVTALLAQLGVGSAGSGSGSVPDPSADAELVREQARERLELGRLASLQSATKVEEVDVERELAAGAPGIDRGQGARIEGWIARLAPTADAASNAKAERAATDFASALASEKPEVAAAKHGLTRLPAFLLSQSGLEPELEGVVFGLPKGWYSQAIKTRTGWVVVRVLERVEGIKLDDQALRARVRRALETRKLQAASRQALAELRRTAAIEILVDL